MGDTKTLQIRGTAVTYADLRRDEAGPFTRVHCESDLTATVANFFGWEILKDNETVISGPKSMKMDDAELALNEFALEPNGMKSNTLEFEADRVSDFSIARVKTDGGGTATKLRFTVRTRTKAACAKIERFMEVVGECVGLLKLRYPKNAQAEMFDAGTDDDNDAQGELIEEGSADGPVLASAREMGVSRGRKAN